MCGLAGWARPADGDAGALDLVRDGTSMLIQSIESRGRHATGIALAGARAEDEYLWKVATTATEVLKTDFWKSLVTDRITATTMCAQGHTRFATFDNSHKDHCAHPFKIGKVTGAHNGIIDNWIEIERDLVKMKAIDKPEFEVDSQVIFALLSHYKDPRMALARLEGYFACTWTKGKHLYLARSDSGALWTAYVGSIKTLFWNSTRQALSDVLKSLGLQPSEYAMRELDANVVFKMNVSGFSTEKADYVAMKADKEWCPSRTYTRWDAERRTGSANPNLRGNRRGPINFPRHDWGDAGDDYGSTNPTSTRSTTYSPTNGTSGSSSASGSNVSHRSYSLREMDERIDGLYRLFNLLNKEQQKSQRLRKIVAQLIRQQGQLTQRVEELEALLETYGISWDDYEGSGDADRQTQSLEEEMARDEKLEELAGDEAESPYLGTAEQRAADALVDEAQKELPLGEGDNERQFVGRPKRHHVCVYCGNEGYPGHDLLERANGDWIGESCVFAQMDRQREAQGTTEDVSLA